MVRQGIPAYNPRIVGQVAFEQSPAVHERQWIEDTTARR